MVMGSRWPSPTPEHGKTPKTQRDNAATPLRTPLQSGVTLLYTLRGSMDSVQAANDAWFQQAAADQIKGERMARAELLNGRVAMLGFVIGVLTEALTGHGILSQISFGVLGLN